MSGTVADFLTKFALFTDEDSDHIAYLANFITIFGFILKLQLFER